MWELLYSILVDDISDHLPSICIIKSLKSVKKKPIQIKSRDTRPRNITALPNHLSKYDWQMLLKGKDVSASMDKFHKVLQYEIDLCIPETTRLLKSKYARRELWLSVSLKRCIDKSKWLYCRSLKSDCLKTRNHYKEYSSTLKKSIKQAKQLFHQEQCNDFKHNSRKLWQIINKITGHLNDKMSSIDYLTIDGVREYDGNTVSNSLAKYFSTVGETFANKIPNPTRNVKDYLSRLQGNSRNLFFEPCTITEVRRIIKNLSAKKSSGADGISNDLLKILVDSIVEPLCMVINESMSTRKFPDLMKLAEVVPLYKGKARDIEMNYHPISLLTTMSKVMEKVIYTRVYTFLTKTGQICETQYGFRANHSCKHAVSQLIGTVLKNLENKKSTITVMLDLSKAFDTIEHVIMLNKLELYGVRGVC